jgi:NACalpha-BTF3-like transcription factor
MELTLKEQGYILSPCPNCNEKMAVEPSTYTRKDTCKNCKGYWNNININIWFGLKKDIVSIASSSNWNIETPILIRNEIPNIPDSFFSNYFRSLNTPENGNNSNRSDAHGITSISDETEHIAYNIYNFNNLRDATNFMGAHVSPISRPSFNMSFQSNHMPDIRNNSNSSDQLITNHDRLVDLIMEQVENISRDRASELLLLNNGDIVNTIMQASDDVDYDNNGNMEIVD